VNGVTTNYAYATVGSGGSQRWRVTKTAPDGTTTYESIPGRPGVTKVTDPLGRVTQFTYDIFGQMLSATWPEGNRIEYVRDARGNPTQTRYYSKTGALTTLYQTFPNCSAWYAPTKDCNQPSSVTDLNGNTTTYTRDPNPGGVLTEVGPAVGGVSPAKKYYYAQRYAWVKNAAGAYVQADSPLWLLSEERACKTTALNLTNGTCAGGAADLILTAYDYGPNSGPNNLWLRGTAVTADGQTLRTCFGYDTHGRRISETRPNANLGSCP
jgi:YD repeat-containing protein